MLSCLSDAERDHLAALLEKLLDEATTDRAAAYQICRLCDPAGCGDPDGRCPVTRAADRLQERPHDA